MNSLISSFRPAPASKKAEQISLDTLRWPLLPTLHNRRIACSAALSEIAFLDFPPMSLMERASLWDEGPALKTCKNCQV